MDTVYLIDANAFFYRAFYAIRDLRTSEGFPTGALFGFATMLKKLIDEYAPSYIACCFDVSRRTFRNELYPEYKLNRPVLDEDLKVQIPFIKQMVRAHGIALLEREGFEADDIIASVARKAAGEGFKVCVVSSDKDLFQLITGDMIVVLDPLKKGILNETQFRAIYGFPPSSMVDFIALAGDSADNIKGVRGIGEKTARVLLAQFGTVESLWDNLEGLGKEKIRQSLKEHKELLRVNKQLALLKDDIEVAEDIRALRYAGPDSRTLYELYARMEFKKLIDAKMNDAVHGQEQYCSPPVQGTTGLAELKRMCSQEKEMVFALEEKRAGVSVRDGAALVPLEEIKDILEDAQVKKVVFDSKETIRALEQAGIKPAGVFFDIKIAASVVDASCVKADEQSAYYFFLKEHLPVQPVLRLKALHTLYVFLKKKLRENKQEEVFFQTEMPLVQVLSAMERCGVKLDVAYLAGLLREADRLIEDEKKAIFQEAGKTFNLNSPQQVAKVLFEELKLPPRYKTKTGYSTNEEVLQSLSGQYVIAARLLSYRTLNKVRSTYIEPFLEEAGERHGMVFTHFDQASTNTGRLASHSPNVQNIPAKGVWAGKIRRAFVSSFEGGCVVGADYSQIELRILASLSGDEQLKRAFEEDKDIHTFTASLLFHKDERQVSTDEREVAKRINFGIVYGISPYGLSKHVSLTPEQADTFIQEYFIRYPGVKTYIERVIGQARTHGYAQTLLGRRRSLPHITSENKSVREFAERQAVNTPIQGSAAEIIKRAMLRFHEALREGAYASRLIIQIHDELICDVAPHEEPAVIRRLKAVMESAFTLAVPLKVVITKGNSWGTMEEVTL